MECLLVFVVVLIRGTVLPHAIVHITAVTRLTAIFLMSVVLVGELQGHLGADASKLGQKFLDHLEICAQLHDLVDLVDFCARKKIQVGIHDEAQNYIATLTLIASSIIVTASVKALVK